MAITAREEPDSPLHDYEFASPEGLLELSLHRAIVVHGTANAEYLRGLSLVLGYDRRIWEHQEWTDLGWEQQAVFKWFVTMGEFSQ